MPEPDYRDQTEFFDPDEWSWPVHIVGMGGIGSAVFLPLLKLGVPEVHLWDDDHVELHNIPAQLIYRRSDVGLPKVVAAKQFAERQEYDTQVIVHEERVSESTKLKGVVIGAVDSMQSRAEIWRAVRFNAFVPLYLDGRIGGEEFNLLTLNPSSGDDVSFYEDKWSFDDAQVAPLGCAARTIIHTPVNLAAMIVLNLTLFARGKHSENSLFAGLGMKQYVTATAGHENR